MKGVMYPTLAVFIIVVSLFIIVFLVPRAMGPSMATYGVKQASIVAKSIATSVNALGSMDEGKIESVLPGGGSWNVIIRGSDITVYQGNFSATERALVRVNDSSLVDVRMVTIEKKGGTIGVS